METSGISYACNMKYHVTHSCAVYSIAIHICLGPVSLTGSLVKYKAVEVRDCSELPQNSNQVKQMRK